MPQEKVWTIIALLQQVADYLQEKHFDHPRLEGERLLAKVLNLKRVDLYLQYDRPLSFAEVSQLRALVQRRLAHEPIQYILGETEFMSLPFFVGPGVLIPRPETEILVEQALTISEKLPTPVTVIDIATGCGNIAIAFAKNNPNCQVIATDCSPRALEYAAKNISRHALGGQVTLAEHDIRTAIPQEWRGRFDLALANPPYIKKSEYAVLADEIKKYEPPEALLAGEDGLDYYRVLSRQLPLLLRPGGYGLLEIGADMGAAVQDIFLRSGFSDIKIMPDLAGRDRVVTFCFTKE